MRLKLVLPAAAVAILATGGLVAVLSEDSNSDTENCVSDGEVANYQDDWSVDHVSELFDVPGYVACVGDDSFRKRNQKCPDVSDYRQVVTYWLDTGLSHGTWEINVG
jgi:ABC-type uncharacterized transport system ATPase subunit